MEIILSHLPQWIDSTDKKITFLRDNRMKFITLGYNLNKIYKHNTFLFIKHLKSANILKMKTRSQLKKRGETEKPYE